MLGAAPAPTLLTETAKTWNPWCYTGKIKNYIEQTLDAGTLGWEICYSVGVPVTKLVLRNAFVNYLSDLGWISWMTAIVLPASLEELVGSPCRDPRCGINLDPLGFVCALSLSGLKDNVEADNNNERHLMLQAAHSSLIGRLFTYREWLLLSLGEEYLQSPQCVSAWTEVSSKMSRPSNTRWSN